MLLAITISQSVSQCSLYFLSVQIVIVWEYFYCNFLATNILLSWYTLAAAAVSMDFILIYSVKLTDITKRKPYKSEYHTDQQICTKSTMPRSLAQMYSQCAKVPQLYKFDRFRFVGYISAFSFPNKMFLFT